MCLNPIKIPNPYRGLAHIGLNRIHDCTSAYLNVPCGNCSVCVALRQSYFVSRVQMESLENHLFMGTLTYDNDSIRSLRILDSDFLYFDWKDVTNMLKRIRKQGFKFKYFFVNEYGGRRHRPHAHFILSVPKSIGLSKSDELAEARYYERIYFDLFLKEWRRNYGSTRFPIYRSLFSYRSNSRGSNYDFHYVDPGSTIDGESDVGFYVTKYLLKYDQWLDKVKSKLKLNLDPEKFFEVWSLLKPRCCISKGFGLSDSACIYIKDCISRSLENKEIYPLFFNPISGQSFPLSPYYKRHYLTADESLKFFDFSRAQSSTIDNVVDLGEYDPAQVYSDIRRFDAVKSSVDYDNYSYSEFLDIDSNERFLEQAQAQNNSMPCCDSLSNSDFEVDPSFL